MNLDILHETLAQHLNQKEADVTTSRLCKRDPTDYFKFLEKISYSWLMRDSYTNFFTEKEI